jgi:hypothetical protein
MLVIHLEGQSELSAGTKSDREELAPLPAGRDQARLQGRPDRDSWCTPKWFADALGPWDLDPCSNARSHIQAVRTFDLARGEDGIALAYTVVDATRVFLNTPYSRGMVAKFFAAYRHTRWCFLLRFDPSTEWFQNVYNAASLIAVPVGRRVNFEPPPGAKSGSNPYPHALFYARAEDATPEILAACIAWKKRTRP